MIGLFARWPNATPLPQRSLKGGGRNALHDLPTNRLFVEGLIARMTKNDQEARAAFTAARVEQEKIVQAQPNYGPALCVLGLIDAALVGKRKHCVKAAAPSN